MITPPPHPHQTPKKPNKKKTHPHPPTNKETEPTPQPGPTTQVFRVKNVMSVWIGNSGGKGGWKKYRLVFKVLEQVIPLLCIKEEERDRRLSQPETRGTIKWGDEEPNGRKISRQEAPAVRAIQKLGYGTG